MDWVHRRVDRGEVDSTHGAHHGLEGGGSLDTAAGGRRSDTCHNLDPIGVGLRRVVEQGHGGLCNTATTSAGVTEHQRNSVTGDNDFGGGAL